MDAEESNNLRRERIKTVPKEEDKIASKDVLTIVDDGKEQDEKVKRQKDEDMLHLTMHNILLQGIIGHMDLKEVYKRVNSLMKNLNNVRDDLKGKGKYIFYFLCHNRVLRYFFHNYVTFCTRLR